MIILDSTDPKYVNSKFNEIHANYILNKLSLSKENLSRSWFIGGLEADFKNGVIYSNGDLPLAQGITDFYERMREKSNLVRTPRRFIIIKDS